MEWNVTTSPSNTTGMGMKTPSIGMRQHQMLDIKLCQELI